MKKVVLFLALAASVSFTSCSKDDDENKCATCSVDFFGTSITTEACDNGDGTVTVSIGGESQIITAEELDGTSPAEYVKALEDGCP